MRRKTMSKKILIVDDEPSMRQTLNVRLTSQGFDVVEAGDGNEGYQKALSEKPDLIILDLLMPNVDGIEASNLLKENDQTKGIPVIFLTALQSKKQEKQQGHLVGSETIFAKPFDSKELLEEIQKILA